MREQFNQLTRRGQILYVLLQVAFVSGPILAYLTKSPLSLIPGVVCYTLSIYVLMKEKRV